ncbi:MAG: DUF2339 domain-containing protein [bacterium]|nr:DUF2339 domain-containing protein [bacterium]
MQENNDTNTILQEIQKSIGHLEKEIKKQGRRIDTLENVGLSAKELQAGEKELGMAELSSTPPPPPPPLEPDEKEEKKESKPAISVEENIAGNWFAKIGIVALILGIVFFLKYAFDNDWIPPVMRVIMGIIAGIALLGVGERTIRKYASYGQVVTAGGIIVLYLSVYAAFGFYDLIGDIPAFIFMALVTVVGILLSLRYDSQALMLMVTLGGFLTPLLISTGQNHQFRLFFYLVILDLAVLTVSFFRRWHALNFVGFIGTLIIFSNWFDAYYSKDQLFSTLFFINIFFLIYSLSAIIYNTAKRELSTGVEQILSVLVAVIYFSQSYALLVRDYENFMGFFALAIGVYYFVLAFVVRGLTAQDKRLYNFLAAITVGFITLAIPLQFDNNIITIGWAIEAVLILYLVIHFKEASFKIFNAILLILVMIRLLVIDSTMRVTRDALIFNERFFTFMFAIAAFYLCGIMVYYAVKKMQAVSENDEHKKWLAMLILVCIFAANFFTIFAGSQEIIKVFDRRHQKMQIEFEREVNENPTIIYYTEIEEEYDEDLKNITSQGSIALSVFWLIYAIIILIIGFMGRFKKVRIGGILLLLVAIFKLFFIDLWSLGTLYRIISSISLGVVLLSISFAYQKFKHIIKELI